MNPDGEMYQLNGYQKEQLQALKIVRESLGRMDSAAIDQLSLDIRPYLEFRRRLHQFTDTHLGRHCTQACFKSQTSACCSKDGIITFWADMVIDAVQSGRDGLDAKLSAIQRPLHSDKCIYLGDEGCLWKVRPLVCAMFLCDTIQTDVIEPNPELADNWEQFNAQAKTFRWPDRPVLFDKLELRFMEMGFRSSLMYINTSPGLMRIKQKAGLLLSGAKHGKIKRTRRP